MTDRSVILSCGWILPTLIVMLLSACEFSSGTDSTVALSNEVPLSSPELSSVTPPCLPVEEGLDPCPEDTLPFVKKAGVAAALPDMLVTFRRCPIS